MSRHHHQRGRTGLAPSCGWVIGLLVLTGCNAPPCPSPCDVGYVCIVESGLCEPLAADCTVLGCPEHVAACNVVTGQCEEVTNCLTDGCPQGQTCNTATHRCEAGLGCSLTGCAPGDVCDRSTGLCRTAPCATDESCAVGNVCSSEGQCISGCRPGSPCGLGTLCVYDLETPEESADAVGRCEVGCQQDVECPFGRVCRPVTGSDGPGECILELPCSAHSDCREDEICRRGSCTRAPCTSGVGCPPRTYCDITSGDCLPASCTDDIFEENDDPLLASPLIPQSYTELRICPGDGDWYEVEAVEGALVEATLRFDHRRGDLDLSLYNGDLQLLDAGRTTGSPETVQGRRRGMLLLHVDGFANASNAYALELRAAAPEACQEDRYGQHRQPETAIALDPGDHEDLTSCPGVDDWYRIPTVGGEAMILTLDTLGPRPEAFLLGPAGSRVEVAETGATVTNAAPGDYHLRVIGGPNEAIEYALSLELYGSGFPCTDDDLEPNDDPEQAIPIGLTEYSGLVACPNNEDWFQWSTEALGGVLEVSVANATGEALPTSMFQVTDPSGRTLPVIASPDGVLTVRTPPLEVGSYLMGVRNVEEVIAYHLELSLISGPEPCQADALEPPSGNDAAGTASPLRPGQYEDLSLCPASPTDWYVLDVAEGSSIRISLAGEGISCALRSGDGASLIEACQSRGELLSLVRGPLERSTLLLWVSGDPPFAGLPYNLSLETSP